MGVVIGARRIGKNQGGVCMLFRISTNILPNQGGQRRVFCGRQRVAGIVEGAINAQLSTSVSDMAVAGVPFGDSRNSGYVLEHGFY